MSSWFEPQRCCCQGAVSATRGRLRGPQWSCAEKDLRQHRSNQFTTTGISTTISTRCGCGRWTAISVCVRGRSVQACRGSLSRSVRGRWSPFNKCIWHNYSLSILSSMPCRFMSCYVRHWLPTHSLSRTLTNTLTDTLQCTLSHTLWPPPSFLPLLLQDMNIVVEALQTYGEELKREVAYAVESAKEGKWGQVGLYLPCYIALIIYLIFI